MKKVLNLCLLGRWGNGLFQYAFARAYAEKHGHELRMGDWIGRKIFDLPDHPPIQTRFDEQVSELSLKPEHAERNFEWRGYAQHQNCLIYTKDQARDWFRFRDSIYHILKSTDLSLPRLVAHRRLGDYIGYGYVVVSKKSYLDACVEYGFDPGSLCFLSEETQSSDNRELKEKGMEFLEDFFRMKCAETLFRGNSCFSWWGATLSLAKVFSPNIEGLEGGREHDVHFDPGNYHRFANLEFVTDLHLSP